MSEPETRPTRCTRHGHDRRSPCPDPRSARPHRRNRPSCRRSAASKTSMSGRVTSSGKHPPGPPRNKVRRRSASADTEGGRPARARCQTESIAALVTRISPIVEQKLRRLAARVPSARSGRSSGVVIRARVTADGRTYVDAGADMFSKDPRRREWPQGSSEHDFRRITPLGMRVRSRSPGAGIGEVRPVGHAPRPAFATASAR